RRHPSMRKYPLSGRPPRPSRRIFNYERSFTNHPSKLGLSMHLVRLFPKLHTSFWSSDFNLLKKDKLKKPLRKCMKLFRRFRIISTPICNSAILFWQLGGLRSEEHTSELQSRSD